MFEQQPENKPAQDPFAYKKPVPSLLNGPPQRPVSEQHPRGSVSQGRAPASLSFTPEVVKHRTDLLSHWVEKPSPVAARAERAADTKSPAPHRAKHQSSGPDDSFDRITLGDQGEYVSVNNAPAQLTLPAELTKGLNQAWDQSLPGERSEEHGGIMVQNQDGSRSWLAGKAGDSGHFPPNFADAKPEQKVLSTGHTHPYSQREGGHTNVPFSGQDLNGHPIEPQRLSVVQSGKGLFASARTREFEELVKARGDAARWDISAEIEEHWNTIYGCVQGDIRQKAEAATRATSAHYHLLYYAGQSGTLRKIDTSLEPPHQECFRDATLTRDTK